MEFRILFHAPHGRDSALFSSVVGASHPISICNGAADLARCLNEGSAATVLAEDALADPGILQALSHWVARQPGWSDYPIVVLARPSQGDEPAGPLASLDRLGNVIVLEHPLKARALASTANTVVRCRRRQYAMRDQLAQLGADRSGQKMQMVGRLAGEIAHDFNNLLHVVNMNLELISLYAKEDKVKSVVERARTAARRGARLTGQLRAFAREQPLSPKPADVNRLLADLQDLIEVSAGSAIAVKLDLCEGPAMVVVDVGQLDMAVLKLAMDARHAANRGGAISVSTFLRSVGEGDTALAAGNYVVIGVSDMGGDVLPQMPRKALDPAAQPGSGSGLAHDEVCELVRQSGGTAFVSSEPGKGNRVEMYFPAAPPEAGAQADDAAPPASESTAPK